jgi:hypothetical protein
VLAGWGGGLHGFPPVSKGTPHTHAKKSTAAACCTFSLLPAPLPTPHRLPLPARTCQRDGQLLGEGVQLGARQQHAQHACEPGRKVGGWVEGRLRGLLLCMVATWSAPLHNPVAQVLAGSSIAAPAPASQSAAGFCRLRRAAASCRHALHRTARHRGLLQMCLNRQQKELAHLARSSCSAWLEGRIALPPPPPPPPPPSLAQAARFCCKWVTRFSRATGKGSAAASALQRAAGQRGV